MQTAINRVAYDVKDWLKESYDKFKNQIDLNVEASLAREQSMDSNDVLLEKNLLAFLNDLINDFKKGYIDYKKALTTNELIEEYKKNGALSKEQITEAMSAYLQQNSEYSQRFKDMINESLQNETKENIAVNIFSEKMKNIFDRLESGELNNQNLLTDESANLTSSDMLNSNDMFKEAFDKSMKDEVGDVAKKVLLRK